ncbi:hypothetical protein [Bartonella queenslandensis]|uniref:hypothetical protein n=1 Tax=Bartonella queenslandensis TaxID=481138 RepID=UPI001BAD56DF|nr:hypothetical protein [Bartonella queenslandensis]
MELVRGYGVVRDARLVCGMGFKVHILKVCFTDSRFYDFANLQKAVEKRPCAFKSIS